MDKIKTNSKEIKPGDTFIAIRNVSRDGHNYIEDAINKGATKIICEEGDYPVETMIVPDTREYLKLFSNIDSGQLKLDIENNKAKCNYNQMLKKLGMNPAYIGTIGFYYKDTKKELNNTTPDTDLLYEMLLEAKNNGCDAIVMEVSSHFSNLTQDHLDYHETMENYCNAKKILFTRTRGEKIAIINADDSYSNNFVLEKNQNITISSKNGDCLIKNIVLSHIDTNIIFEYQNKEYNVTTKMIGRYNVYNYLTSLLLVHKLGFSIFKCSKWQNGKNRL